MYGGVSMDFIRKKWGVSVKDIWFKETCEAKDNSFLCIAYNLYEPLISAKGIILKKWQSKTFVSDISLSPEEMQIKFKSKVRNEIRRAIKEGINTKLFVSADLQENDIIADFDRAYIAMYRDKGEKAKSIEARLRGIANVGKLAISVAYLPDGEIAAYHSYVIGDGIARLLHSVSMFREEPEKRKMIGWANRLLHFRDMCVLGSEFSIYDWGGLSREKNMRNITRFKEEFGGDEKIVYYYVILGSQL